MEKVELELKANYIVLHSVAWGLCDEAYFLNFQKTSKINQLPCFMVSSHFDTTNGHLFLLNLNSLVQYNLALPLINF